MSSIKSYRSPKTEVRQNSRIQGRGFFAKEGIKKGEIVAIKSGHIVSWEEAKKFAEELGDYYLQIDDDFFLSPTTKQEVEDTALFINHSCNPNIGPDGQITFVALRDIKAGEELCYDYAMTTAKDFEMECNCGSKDCRGIITSDDWKSKGLQEKYGNHFAWFILKKIKNIK